MSASNSHFWGQEKTPTEAGALPTLLGRDHFFDLVVNLFQVVEGYVSALRLSRDIGVVGVGRGFHILRDLVGGCYFECCHVLSNRSMASGLSTRVSMPGMV